MRSADIRATTVSVLLEAPLRHANGCHWGRFVRTTSTSLLDTNLNGGRIINIASLSSFLAFKEVAAYSASKTAVLLASGGAAFITGQAIAVNGGYLVEKSLFATAC
jgi:NAD(P)-dependent dehydrogenase (short-subunit alcohol dehydrogenase family)